MRIIIIRIIDMLSSKPKITELVISRKDIDFSKHTVEKLTRNLLNQIEIVSKALCESPTTLKNAINGGQVKIGAYDSDCGSSWIYINMHNHNYVIPCVHTH